MMPIETIKKRGDFLAAAAQGRKFVTGALILQMRECPAREGASARFGFTVTKKMGNAVVRNRIKRRLRAALRQLPPKYVRPACDYVIISRHKALTCAFSELTRDMEFAFSRIPTMKVETKHVNAKRP